MRILGIDPGFGIIGFGVIELVGSDWELVDYGSITTDKDSLFDERLLQIYQDIHELLEEFQPNFVAIEELFFSKNVTTGMKVAEARGVIRLAITEHKLEIFEYKPNEIKASISGYGGADKIQMQNMVQNILGLAERPKPDDAADALAVALTCAFDRVII